MAKKERIPIKVCIVLGFTVNPDNWLDKQQQGYTNLQILNQVANELNYSCDGVFRDCDKPIPAIATYEE